MAFVKVLYGNVLNVNMKNWTVDVYCTLTDRYYQHIQIMSPYLHHFAGEGFAVMPDTGCNCAVCYPSDSSPPFVMGFLAPVYIGGKEPTVTSTESEVKDTGQQQTAVPTDWSYAANRPQVKPGDMVWRGRDGCFIILHRGGALTIGSSELSQRIHIPLQNQMIDISGEYEHHNTAGSIRWGMQEGQFIDRGTEWVQTFRLLADSKYADMAIKMGTVHNKFPLPDHDKDEDDISSMEIGKNGLVAEVTIAPGGFNAETGAPIKGANNAMKYQYKIDKDGNSYLRYSGNMLMSVKGDMKLKVIGDLSIEAKSLSITCSEDAKVGSDGGTTTVKGSKVQIGGKGGRPIARQGDGVSIFVPPGAIINGPITLTGLIISGSTTSTSL